jgi:activating signal cointegrator 1
MTSTIKAITLHQPWATLIALGAKQYETRSWPTRYRGLLVIHAGKTLMIDPKDRIMLSLLADVGIRDPRKLPLGAAVCVCELTAVYRSQDVAPHLNDRERAFGDFSPGRAAWELKNVQRFIQPIPCKGAQKLWDWTLPLPSESVNWEEES